MDFTNITNQFDLPPDKQFLKILLVFISSLGLLTNSMIVIVLSQLRGHHSVGGGGERSARVNLLGLAIADFCTCLSTLPLIYSKRTFKNNDPMLYYTLFGPGLVSTFLTVSAWSVVLVSILRYIAVRWPLQSRFFLRCRSVVNIMVTIYLAALVFNLPLFLRYTYEEASFGDESNSSETSFVHIVDWTFYNSEILKDVYNIAHIICTNVGPFIATLVTNVSLIVACRQSEKLRLQFQNETPVVPGKNNHLEYTSEPSQSQPPSSQNTTRNRFQTQNPSRCQSLRPRALHRITPLLLAVIFTFLLLSTPFGIVQFVCLKLIDRIGSRIHEGKALLQQYLILNTVLEWTNLLQVFGSAVNFFLYFMVSRTFRRITKRMLTRVLQRCGQRRGLNHLFAYVCSACCCNDNNSCKTGSYIVRVYSPVGYREHARQPVIVPKLQLPSNASLPVRSDQTVHG